jgi:hypothetical protein
MGFVTSSKFAPLRVALGPPPEVSPEGSGAIFSGPGFVTQFIDLMFEFLSEVVCPGSFRGAVEAQASRRGTRAIINQETKGVRL